MEGRGSLVRPRAWLPALFVLPPCWRPARWPATSPPEREKPPESVVGEGARLTDGADVAALELEAPAGEEPARTRSSAVGSHPLPFV